MSSKEECLAAAGALMGAVSMVDDIEAATNLTRLAQMWEQEAETADSLTTERDQLRADLAEALRLLDQMGPPTIEWGWIEKGTGYESLNTERVIRDHAQTCNLGCKCFRRVVRRGVVEEIGGSSG